MTSRSHARNSATGFSLVELMVVMAIMLLLAAMAVPRFLDAQMRAYEASAVSFLKILQSNQEAHRLAHGSYADNFLDLDLVALGPTDPGGLVAPGESPQLAALISSFGPFSVYAAQESQQPPAKTPPPQSGEQPFGGAKAPKKRGGAGGAIGGPPSGGAGGGGSGGGPAKGGSAGAGGGSGRPRKGGAGGAAQGGTPSGGGTGSTSPGGTTPPPTGGGTSVTLTPTPAPAQRRNVVMKHNYIFTLERPTLTTWTCTVAPVRDRGNARFFFFDQTGVMRAEMGKIASVNSPQL